MLFMGRRKNLIIIHMESLSNQLFWHNASLFKFTNSILKDCIIYNKFYTTGTSTLMVIADLIYGDMQYEAADSLYSMHKICTNKKMLFEILKSNKYSTKTVFYPQWEVADSENVKAIMGEVTFVNDFRDFLGEINSSLSCMQPFALYLCNGKSGISFLDYTEISWHKSWENGYKSCDDTIAYVFKILKEKDLLENTLVLMYGDHGDDFWTHSFNNGFCHSTQPYSNLVHTPLFIFNSDIRGEYVSDVISTTDIKDLLLSMLGISEEIDSKALIYDGYRCKRKYAFSRNLYVNQLPSSTPLLKSYSLISDKYNLMVSVQGMELFSECCDGTSHCNLLDFFDMDNDGKITVKDGFKEINNKHYQKAMTDKRRKEITNDFYMMRKELMERIASLYKSVPAKADEWKTELDFVNSKNSDRLTYLCKRRDKYGSS